MKDEQQSVLNQFLFTDKSQKGTIKGIIGCIYVALNFDENLSTHQCTESQDLFEIKNYITIRMSISVEVHLHEIQIQNTLIAMKSLVISLYCHL